jgi:hypothetical protein
MGWLDCNRYGALPFPAGEQQEPHLNKGGHPMIFEVMSTPALEFQAAGCTCSCPCGTCNCKTQDVQIGQVGRAVSKAAGEAGAEAVDPAKLALSGLTF